LHKVSNFLPGFLPRIIDPSAYGEQMLEHICASRIAADCVFIGSGCVLTGCGCVARTASANIFEQVSPYRS